MAGEREQKLKEAIKQIFNQFDYADYVGRRVEDFKSGLAIDELKELKKMWFNDWLVEQGIVEVLSFGEWQKKC